MLTAITRKVSRSILNCELTHMERSPIDIDLARQQHQKYEETLQGLGLAILSLPEEPDMPDSVFVEDAAIVLDECAIITRPGAESRRPEIASIAAALAPYRKLLVIQPPGTMDGGDVLIIGIKIYVGLTRRSNQSAVDQMQELLRPYGYSVHGVPVSGCLHLKSAVTQVAEATLLINPAWVDRHYFHGMKFIEVESSEPYAANALMVSDVVLYQPAYPKTRERLEAAGISLILMDQSELAKAEGALTCCSLIFTV